MKKLFTAALALLIPLLISPSAGALFIADTYYGGTTVQTGVLTPLSVDVIGTGFDVAGMDVTRSGGNITVVLSGDFFTTLPLINTPGDLYISSTGWQTSDGIVGGHHPTDKFIASEGWNYYVSLSGHLLHIGNFNAIQGTLNSTIDATSAPTGSNGRINQALSGGVNPSDPLFIDKTATVILPTLLNPTLTFTFPDLWPTNTLGLHWTMLCGNDVVEGEVPTTPTPEPGTMLLAGCGLIGLAVFRRKFKK